MYFRSITIDHLFPNNCKELYRVLYSTSFDGEISITIDCASQRVEIEHWLRADGLARTISSDVLQLFRERVASLPSVIANYEPPIEVVTLDGIDYKVRYCDTDGNIKEFKADNPHASSPHYRFVDYVFLVAWDTFLDDPDLDILENLFTYRLSDDPCIRNIGGKPHHIRLFWDGSLQHQNFVEIYSSIGREAPLLLDIRNLSFFSEDKEPLWENLFIKRYGKTIWLSSSPMKRLIELGVPENNIVIDNYEEALAKFDE